MRRRRRHNRRTDPTELNITAFMNLMVILVPFLLITAVFSRVTILELNLPASSASNDPSKKQSLQLEVTVRKGAIEIGDRIGGLIRRIPNKSEEYDLDAVSDILQHVKTRFQNKTDAAILLEPDIPYDALVQVMDVVRSFEAVEDGEAIRGELFPDISIGDAPLVQTAAKAKK